jgi:hypothetical protein
MGHAEAIFGTEAASTRPLVRRVIRAVRLEPQAWSEIAREPSALRQAAVVAIGASLPSALVAASKGDSSAAAAAFASLLAFASTLLTWPLVAAVIWLIANGMRRRVDFAGALRVVGFAMAPLALLVLGAIPLAPVQAVVSLLAWALFFAALVAGTREAAHIDTMRAALVCTLAAVVLFLLAVGAVLVAD